MPSFNRLALVAGTLSLALTASTAPSQAQWWNLFDRDRQNAAPQPGRQVQPPVPVQGGAAAAQGMPQPSFRDDPAGQMERLETQVRALTGQVEKLSHQLDELRAIIQTQQEDNEYRFQALEGGNPTAVPAGQSALEQPMDGGGAEEPMDGGGEALAAAGPGEPPQVLGTLTLTDPNALAPEPTVTDPNAPLDLSRLARPDGGLEAGGGTDVASLPSDTADAAYDRAYTQLVSGDYGLAETGFRQFIADYPDSQMIPDATYWLGETFFARGDYRNAADIYLSAYRNYPDGRKAPDTLLKLGLSLNALGERKAACSTYGELLAKHQGASNALLQRVKAEQARAEC